MELDTKFPQLWLITLLTPGIIPSLFTCQGESKQKRKQNLFYFSWYLYNNSKPSGVTVITGANYLPRKRWRVLVTCGHSPVWHQGLWSFSVLDKAVKYSWMRTSYMHLKFKTSFKWHLWDSSRILSWLNQLRWEALGYEHFIVGRWRQWILHPYVFDCTF